MNKHFEDTRYYLKRAGEEAKRGVSEELEPLRDRFERLTGEDEPDPSRVEQLRADLKELQAKAEGDAKSALQNARAKLGANSSDDAEN